MLSIINIRYPNRVRSCFCIKRAIGVINRESKIERQFVALKDLLNCQ